MAKSRIKKSPLRAPVITRSRSGRAGGILVGNKHSRGGIKAINKSDPNRPIEVEGGEVVITAPAVADEKTLHQFDGKKMTKRQILSEINVQGGGVAFAKGGRMPKKIRCSGKKYKYGAHHDIVEPEIIACDTTMAKGGLLKDSLSDVIDLLSQKTLTGYNKAMFDANPQQFVKYIADQAQNIAASGVPQQIAVADPRHDVELLYGKKIVDLAIQAFPKKMEEGGVVDSIIPFDNPYTSQMKNIDDQIAVQHQKADEVKLLALVAAQNALAQYHQLRPEVVRLLTMLSGYETDIAAYKTGLAAVADRYSDKPEKLSLEVEKLKLDFISRSHSWPEADFAHATDDALCTAAARFSQLLQQLGGRDKDTWDSMYTLRHILAAKLDKFAMLCSEVKAINENILQPMGIATDDLAITGSNYPALMQSINDKIQQLEKEKEQVQHKEAVREATGLDMDTPLPEQKEHFLKDHHLSPRIKKLNLKATQIADIPYQKWNEIPDAVKTEFTLHVHEGQYAEGGTIESDTILLPQTIAEGAYWDVLEKMPALKEQSAVQDASLEKKIVPFLVKRAETLYKHSPDFRKKVNGKGETGRDYLWAMMMHWTEGWLKATNNGKKEYKEVPVYKKGGKVNKYWIAKAISHPGALRKTAKKEGLIRGKEKLSAADLKKLEKQGGKTKKRAILAETLQGFHKPPARKKIKRPGHPPVNV